MSMIVVGLNDRTAAVALREQLTLSGSALEMALQLLSQEYVNGDLPVMEEAVILSTCNRLEIYAATSSSADMLEVFLCRLYNSPRTALHPYLYFHEDNAAVDHLIRVSCGLDSMILGETQILGQVARAFSAAQAANLTGPILSHLFAQAAHAGKRARTETAISRHTTS
ncbi:MAG: glutamyl-tRNA reductase, partial [Anaerolineae bacterium]|nr:glutamyl-tRNA reductase [Anaerolineae bacterium]